MTDRDLSGQVSYRPGVSVPAAYAAIGPVKDWVITHAVMEKAQKAGIGRDEITAAAEDPETTAAAPYGDVDERSRGGISVLVPRDHPNMVIGVRRLQQERSSRTRRRKAGGGGPQAAIPETFQELALKLQAHGFMVDSSWSGAHPKCSHPSRPGIRIAVPTTWSDHRAVRNFAAAVRRTFGVDILKDPPPRK